MMMNIIKVLAALLFVISGAACERVSRDAHHPVKLERLTLETQPSRLKVGAERLGEYIPLLEDKSVAIIANATSIVGDTHLVDALLAKDVNVIKIFAPEHGFRGESDAGEKVEDEIDAKTGLTVFSLYGANKKPSANALRGVDVMVFDIQDVGVRFYTYLSTLHYVMESCAENQIPLVLLDRPNPNGFYVDGPVLKPEFASFVGLHPVPLVYGMTIGEYGRMINGEGWLTGGLSCDLTVIELEHYTHDTKYSLPVNPSPNLPNMTAIYLYPSLALFEGTVVSVGRGTEFPFQVVGHPDYLQGKFQFTPRPMVGAMRPKLQDETCRGLDFREMATFGKTPAAQLSFEWIISLYETLPDKEGFFLANNFFNKLSGNDQLMQQIKNGLSPKEIRDSWQVDLENFQAVRQKYLFYK